MQTMLGKATAVPAIAVLAAVYFIAGKLGLMLALAHPAASAVWPPTGIALAAVLLQGYRVWPGVLLGAFLVNLTNVGSVLSSLGIAAGNTLEALAAAYLVNTFARGRRAFERPQEVYKFTLLAAVATTISATVGVSSLALTGFAPWDEYGSIWSTWWLGDLAGALIVAPLLILWGAGRPQLDHRRTPEVAALLLATALTGMAVFAGFSPISTQQYPVGFLAFPVLIWAAYRFGPRATATVIALLSIIAIGGILRGLGPFSWRTPNESLLLLQAFLCVTAVTSLSLAAAIQERGRTEQARTRLAAIVASSDDAILSKTLQGVITDWNAGAQRLYGYSAEEATGQSVSILIPPDRADELAAILARLARGEHIEHYETVRLRKDGQPVDVSVSISPVRDARGAIVGAAAIARDITGKKAMETLRKEFLSLAAHELKTPLTVIRGASQLLLRLQSRGAPPDPRQTELLRSIEERTSYMTGLVEDMLDLSRIETGRLRLQPEPMDLALLLRQTVAQQQLLNPQRALVLEGAAAPVPGTWDRTRLEQVFANLLDNALKYSPADQPVTVALRQQEGGVEVTVEDRGIGVPAAELNHLFERHFRASNVDPVSAGLGLGLYLSSEVVGRHGGRIWAESFQGAGSTFHVSLPQSAPAAEA